MPWPDACIAVPAVAAKPVPNPPHQPAQSSTAHWTAAGNMQGNRAIPPVGAVGPTLIVLPCGPARLVGLGGGTDAR